MPERTRPALKWPGGKYRLLDFLLANLPGGGRLVEPFTGSGAVFLNAGFGTALLADLNPDVIGFHQALRDGGSAFIEDCRRLFTAAGNRSAAYYARRERFNRLSAGPERAALFLYLNRHGYNGLVRYNAAGGFNVPFGRYRRPYFPETELLAGIATFRRARVTFRVCDFREVFAGVGKGDVVYCDPPYLPLSATANFTAYAGNAFGEAEQRELATLARRAADRGARVAVSNHDLPLAREMYREADRVLETRVRRSISRDGGKREMAGEILAVYGVTPSPIP